MNMVSILHLSDLHFGSEELVYTHSELESGLRILFKNLTCERLYLLITGDITFQGRAPGYKEAEGFLTSLLKAGPVRPTSVLLCPGNHDIVKTSATTPFADFDAFAYALRSDKVFTYSANNYVICEEDEALFLGINTAYRLDHQYGSADVKNLRARLNSTPLPRGKVRIAFLHHHLINQFENDISALRNAYDLLSLLDEFRFQYVFHGHQHSNQSMPIGESRMRMFGVRSFNFDTPGFLNGFNLYEISKNGIVVKNYAYSRDAVSTGGLQERSLSYLRETEI